MQVAPGSTALGFSAGSSNVKLKCEPLSNFALNFNLRHYIAVSLLQPLKDHATIRARLDALDELLAAG